MDDTTTTATASPAPADTNAAALPNIPDVDTTGADAPTAPAEKKKRPRDYERERETARKRKGRSGAKATPKRETVENYKIAGQAIVSVFERVNVTIFESDMELTPTEKKELESAFANWYRVRGVSPETSPTFALCIALFAYYVPRLQRPTPKTKLHSIGEALANAWRNARSKIKLRRAASSATVSGADDTTATGESKNGD